MLTISGPMWRIVPAIKLTGVSKEDVRVAKQTVNDSLRSHGLYARGDHKIFKTEAEAKAVWEKLDVTLKAVTMVQQFSRCSF